MSDFDRNDPMNMDGTQGNAGQWNPYAPPARQPASAPTYTHYGADDVPAPAAPPAEGDVYAAFRRPASQEDAGFLAPSSGMPQGEDGAMGGMPMPSYADAPAGQMVSRRKTVTRGDSVRFKPLNVSFETGEYKKVQMNGAEVEVPVTARAVRHRRTARYQEMQAAALEAPTRAEDAAPAQSMPSVQPTPPARPAAPPPMPAPMQPSFASEGDEQPMRRPAAPGGRYQGMRTAMPSQGAPMRRDEIGRMPDFDDMEDKQRIARPASVADRARQVRDGLVEQGRSAAPMEGEQRYPQQRPPMPQRPAQPGQRPVPQGGRPMPQRPMQQDGRPMPQRPMASQRPPQRMPEVDEYGRPLRPEQDMPQYARPMPSQGDMRRPPMQEMGEYTGAVNVRRPRYDFEEEAPEDKPRRGSGCLVPLVVVLLIVGALLAALVLPNWAGTPLEGVQGVVKDAFTSVKNMIAPEETPVKSFTVYPVEGEAPQELNFTVQTAPRSSVTGVRILDNEGMERACSTFEQTSGSVAQNEGHTIWQLAYALDKAYAGNFTVETQKKDGTWVAAEPEYARAVNISEPEIVLPPVSSFEAGPLSGTVPAIVTFTVETSKQVNSVAIVNTYGNEVVSAGLDDVEAIEDVGDTLIWTLHTDVEQEYTGSYTLQTRTEDSGMFENYAQPVFATFMAPQPEPVEPEPDVTEPDEPEPDVTEPDEPEPDVTEPDEPEPDVTEPDEPEPVEPEPVEPEPASANTVSLPEPLEAMAAAAVDAAKPDEMGLKTGAYKSGKATDNFDRTNKINFLEPYAHAVWEGGVFTFRGGPFRQNAAFGTADISAGSMDIAWTADMGSTKTKSKTVYGAGYGAQPAIVKWYKEARGMMKGLKEDKADKEALKEVILGSLDGKIYFLDLADGAPTREPIDVGAPLGGSVNVATNGTPILGVGQAYSFLSGKTVKNEYRLFNLINDKEIAAIPGVDKAAYATNTAFSTSGLFDKRTGSLVLGADNGLLYTMETGENFNYMTGSLKLTPSTQSFRALASKQKKAETSVTTSVSMYANYAYFANTTGILQCVDVNTMNCAWAVPMGDTVEATPALDDEPDGSIALYTGTMINKLGKKGACILRRYDALTGELKWEYTVEGFAYTKGADVGLKASPAVGQNGADDLVIFTVTGKDNAAVIAMDKASGQPVWQHALDSAAVSSPIILYSPSGDAWVMQGDSSGLLTLLNASDGSVANTLKLEGAIEASPAAYRDMVVVATGSKEGAHIYGIKIQ